MKRLVRARRKRYNIRRYVLAGLALVAVGVLLVILLQPSSVRGFGSELHKVEGNAKRSVLFAGGTVLMEGDSLFYVDEAGTRTWGFDGATEDMVLVPARSRLAVSVSAKLQVISSAGQLEYAADFLYPIQALRAGDGICAVLQYRENNQRAVAVIGQEGAELDVFYEEENSAIVDFGIYEDAGNGLWILYVNTAASRPVFQLQTYKYDPAKRTTFSYSDAEQVVYTPVFGAAGVDVIGADNIIRLDSAGKQVSRWRVKGYELFGASQGAVFFYPLNPQGEKPEGVYRLRIAESGTAQDVALNEPILHAAAGKGYYYIFTPYNCYRYQKSNMERVQFPLPARLTAAQSSQDAALLETEAGLYRLKLS